MKNNSQENVSKDNINICIGQRIREYRIKYNFTQEQMAEVLGISTAFFGRIERGVNRLTPEKLAILYNELNVDLNYLIAGEKRMQFSQWEEECPLKRRRDLEILISAALDLIANEGK